MRTGEGWDSSPQVALSKKSKINLKQIKQLVLLGGFLSVKH